MNFYYKQLTLCAALATLALPLSAADSSSQQRSSQQNDQSSQTSSLRQKAERDCSVRNILQAKASSKDGQSLGQIEDVLINPKTGKADFVVLGKNGVQGTGEDFVPVPWQAVKMGSDGSVVIHEDKAKLQNAPSLNKDYSSLNQPDYTVTLYEFYAVPGPEGSGAATNWNSTSPRPASRSNVRH